jgi:hypothetical protein
MNNKLWDFLGDNFVSLATVIGGVVVLILSMIGIIDDPILLQAILALLVLIATSGIVERHRRLDAIYEQTLRIVKSENDVKVFDDIDVIYRKTIEDKMSKGIIRVRRVVIPYDLSTVDWIKGLLKKYNGSNFWVAYYDKPGEYIPVLNMMLIDEREVFVGGFYQENQYDERGSIWLNDKKIANAFQDYYNYLWRSAKPLNPKEVVQEKLIEKITKRCIDD